MGTDKAMLEIQGQPLIQRISQLLREVFDKVIVVSDKEDRYKFLGLPIYADIRKNCGPLGGIHSAFVNSQADSLFVLACDTPFVSKELVEYICEFESPADIKVPEMENRIHPLCGLYSRRILQDIEMRLKSNQLSVQSLIESVKSRVIPITSELPFNRSDLLANFNSQKDFERLVRLPESH